MGFNRSQALHRADAVRRPSAAGAVFMRLINRPADGPFTRAERIMITLPVLAASLLHSVNMSTAYVALPSIQGNLSASPDQIGWVITAFVVAGAVGTILTGWLSGRFGRRRVFMGSIICFIVTAMLCASADTLGQLVAYRALQGFASAPLLPISQAIMLDTYPRERHGFAMGVWSMGMILGPVLGPTAGAVLTELFDWRYLFFINVPLGLIALAGIWPTLPESKEEQRNLDWIGVVSLIVAVSTLQLVLDRGQRLGWLESGEIVFELGLCVTASYIFITQCLTAANPYLRLSIFSDRNFTVGLALIFVFGICAFSTMLVLPLFLQNIQSYPVITAGWVLSARGIGTMVAMFLGGLLADRLSMRYLVLFGLICIFGSNYIMTGWTADVGTPEVVSATILSGFGMGMMWVTLTAVTFSTLSPVLRVEAAALFALVRSIGASAGTSLLVTFIVRSTQVNYIEMRSLVTGFSEGIKNAGVLGDPGSTASLLSLYQIVTAQAQVVGFINAFIFLSVVAVVAMPLVFLLQNVRR